MCIIGNLCRQNFELLKFTLCGLWWPQNPSSVLVRANYWYVAALLLNRLSEEDTVAEKCRREFWSMPNFSSHMDACVSHCWNAFVPVFLFLLWIYVLGMIFNHILIVDFFSWSILINILFLIQYFSIFVTFLPWFLAESWIIES